MKFRRPYFYDFPAFKIANGAFRSMDQSYLDSRIFETSNKKMNFSGDLFVISPLFSVRAITIMPEERIGFRSDVTKAANSEGSGLAV